MNQTKIVLNIPKEALLEMTTDTIGGAYTALTQTGKTTLISLLTFGFSNTPIYHTESGKQVGVVVYWASGFTTVCQVAPDDPSIYSLIGLYSEYGAVITTDEAVAIYERALKDVDSQQSNDR